jgi:hypothetical protein
MPRPSTAVHLRPCSFLLSCRLIVALLPAITFLLVGPFVAESSATQIFQTESSIAGRVHDGAGLPLAGALVAVRSAGEAFRERLVFTDRSGGFSIGDLRAGEYLIRVTKARFLPAVTSNIELHRGANLTLTVNLQTALDLFREGIRRGSLEDMKWVLRSSPSARPVLHLADGPTGEASPVSESAPGPVDSAGYFQLYSSAVETPAGVADAVGSEFAFSMPVAATSQVTFAGQYSQARNRPRGFSAAYDFSRNDGKRTSLTLSVREGALLNSMYGRDGREIQLDYDEQVQLTDRLVLGYGAAFGRADGTDTNSYIRPAFGVTWVPSSQTTVSASFSRRAPIDASDAIRGREYFDRTVYIPSELEQYSHVEVGATQWVTNNVRISLAGFRDVLGTQAFLVDAEDGRRGVVFFDASRSPTAGVRIYLDRAFSDFEVGLGYTFANAVGFDPDVTSPDNLYKDADRQNLHMITARVQTEIERTHTAVTAVYRWVSGFSLAPVDPYQRFAEYSDPTLSITVAQDLPALWILPGKLQAIVDARNLLEPSFGSRRTVYAGNPRLVKGGIHIRF